jgi:hypothetical protein
MFINERQALEGSVIVLALGMAILIPTEAFFPGILFVMGAVAAAQSLVRERTWFAGQGAIWLVGAGLLLNFGIRLPLIIAVAAVSLIFLAIFRPPFLGGSYERTMD